jgi:hypothetical protein
MGLTKGFGIQKGNLSGERGQIRAGLVWSDQGTAVLVSKWFLSRCGRNGTNDMCYHYYCYY